MAWPDKKRIRDGNPDFKSLIESNGYYVDKTRFIEVLEDVGEFNVLLRPKRFGKSLFTSMLQYYYDVRYKDEFDRLFGGLYIHDRPTELAHAFHVLKFDFSGIESDRDDLETDFTFAVRSDIERFIEANGFDFRLSESAAKANHLLKDFLGKYKNATGTKLYLLIDEYDNSANGVLGKDFGFFTEITWKDGFVRSFYEVFKSYSGSVIDRIYITGVTPITLDALTSGFNHANNISLDGRLAGMIGFTQGELDEMLGYYDIPPVHRDVMAEYYDGYRFSGEEGAVHHVYNPTLAIYYLKSMVGKGKPPMELIDTRISTNPSAVRRMIDLYKDSAVKLDTLRAIFEKRNLEAGIQQKFNQEQFMEKQDDFVSMLYYLGLLTIQDSTDNRSILTIPNRTVEDLYSHIYLGYVNHHLVPSIDALTAAVNDMLLDGHTDAFVGYVHHFLSYLDDHDFDHMNEQGIKNIFLAFLRLYQNMRVESEIDVPGGRIDLALFDTPLHTYAHYYVIELKYLSKAMDTPKNRTDKRLEAIKQLERYRDYGPIADLESRARVHRLVVLTIKDEVTVEEI
ncbi:MAG: ATP-binding protein [Lachnospiraceae bacterium]|jgi:hypothetical protein|nr:ATP-binding protein [Lachnospiraceae bacterium]